MSNLWRKYNLTYNPFADDYTRSNPYISEHWEQQLTLIHELSLQNNVALLVTGLSGVGKSTFMEVLLPRLSKNAGVCCIHGNNSITIDVVQDLMIKHLGVSDAVSESKFEQRFAQKLNKMEQTDTQFYMVIDDAHQLSKSTLSFIIQLVEWQSEKSHPVHFMLLGGPQLDAIMAEIVAYRPNKNSIYTIRLEPFSLETTKQYLIDRFLKAGANKNLPFTTAQVKKLYQVTQGIVKKINKSIYSLLMYENQKQSKNAKVTTMENHNQTENQKKIEQKSKVFTWPWLSLACFLVLATILFMMLFSRTGAHKETSTYVVPRTNLSDQSQPSVNIDTARLDSEQMNQESYQDSSSSSKNNAYGSNSDVVGHIETSDQSQIASSTQTPAQINASSPDNSGIEQNSVQQTKNNDASMSSSSLEQPMSSVTQDNNQTTTANSQVEPSTGSLVSDGSGTSVQNDSAQNSNQSHSVAANSQASQNSKALAPTSVNSKNSSKENSSISTGNITESGQTEVKASTAKTASVPSTETAQPKPKSKVVETKSVASKPKQSVSYKQPITLALSEKALLKFSSKRYTLQLVASGNFNNLSAFAQKTQLSNLYIYQTHLNGKPWFVLVYGDYANEKEAKAAIKYLSKSIKDQNPWPKTFGSIQQIIKK